MNLFYWLSKHYIEDKTLSEVETLKMFMQTHWF